MTLPAAATTQAQDSFVNLDATALADLVQRKEVTPLELAEAVIARIEAFDLTLNAVTVKLDERARSTAQGPLPDGPFKGVPFLIKDLRDYAGARSTNGSRFFTSNIAVSSAPPVQAYEKAGLVMVGKTNTPEFGLLATTEPLLFGPTHNPWSLSRSPGGSSGGAAAAVAAGLVPMAHATDGGGSIRIPASCCGVFGMKPSRGRMPSSGEPASDFLSIDHCISRSVRDSARLFAATEVSAPGLERVGFVSGPDKDRLMMAFSTQNIYGEEVDSEVKAAIEETAKLCAQLGHEVVEDRPVFDGAAFVDHFMTLWTSGANSIVAMVKASGVDPQTVLEPWTLGLAAEFEGKPQGSVEAALSYFGQLEQVFAKFYGDYNVYLTPVLRTPPIAIGVQGPIVAYAELRKRVLDYVSYTPVHNAAGTPAMSVPLSWSSAELPIGSQFSAARGRDKMLFALAYELEAAKPWANRWPPVSAFNGGHR